MIIDEQDYNRYLREMDLHQQEQEAELLLHANDDIVRRVLSKIADRSQVGQSKYNSTMWGEIERNDKNLMDFMTDVQEEMMDALLYLESAKECLKRSGLTHKLFKQEDE